MATKAKTSTMTETLTLNAPQVTKALMAHISDRLPLFLWGPPGIGKSDIVRSVTQKLGGTMIDLRLSQMDPTDIRGLPYYNKDSSKMEWAPPVMLPDEEFASKYPIVVLFLDELNSAPPMVQTSAYQLILDRRVGTYRLPDNVAIVAAGNRESDKGVTFRMAAPLANRMDHIEMRADFDPWQTWAVHNNVHPDVVGFLSRFPQHLYNFDSRSSNRSFPTPRSWARVSKIVFNKISDDDTKFNLVAGAVGEGIASEFMQYRKNSSILPDPQKILDGTITTLSDKADFSVKYSLIVSMCYALKEAADNKTPSDKFNEMVDHYLKFMMDNFEEHELNVMGGKIALKTYELPIKTPKLKNYTEYCNRYAKFILAANDVESPLFRK